MRSVCLLLLSAVYAFAQDGSSSSVVRVDLNGNAVQGPEVTQRTGDHTSETTEKLHSLNGNLVPWQRVQEHVLRDDASGRKVERIVQLYDPNGQPTSTERVMIEETKRPDGSSTVESTSYKKDINGNNILAEHSTTDTQKSGNTVTSNTVVERPTINQSFETVEKRTSVRELRPGGYNEDAVTYRQGENGFYAAVRQITEHAETKEHSTDKTQEFEVGTSGQLELHGGSVRQTDRGANGLEKTSVEVLGVAAPGVIGAANSGLKVKEELIFDRKPNGSGALVETYSVRHPTLADPNVLGPAKFVSETVCRGKCDAEPAPNMP